MYKDFLFLFGKIIAVHMKTQKITVKNTPRQQVVIKP